MFTNLALLPCWCFYFIFWAAETPLIIFSSENRQLCHETVKFWIQKGGQIIKILYFLSNADVSNKFAKF